MKTESAFCETSSAIISLNERGVAVLLAAEKADIIEPTAKIEITSMLPEMVLSNCSSDSVLISGTNSYRLMV